MHYVSLIVEFLRGRPAVVFWTVALTQAALWTLMPTLFYSAPPGEVPMLLAIGHEFHARQLSRAAARLLARRSRLPARRRLRRLSRWRRPASSLTYWAVFTLGRAIVGTRHAVLAVLLMAGIAAFTVPSPNSAPAIMAAPFWALALLHYWRALGEDKRGYWFLLAIDLGLLLLRVTSALILLALMAAVHAGEPARPRGARQSGAVDRAAACSRSSCFRTPGGLYETRDLVIAGFNDSAAAGRLSPGAAALPPR